MFDIGVNWIRIGQYENSSEPTSWDWVEQRRGVYSIAPEVDDYVDSLVENHVTIQVQLLYGNPMYTGPAGRKPDQITPEPGSFHNDDRSINSIFWAPRTPEEIAAFIKYVKWMVNHFKGKIKHWALWNEQDIGYWNDANPEDYGRVLAAFAPAVHEADPEAKVIYGGQADPTADFTKRALDTCKCASQIDIYAYHTYPGYGKNVHPESMDTGTYGKDSPAKLRELVRNYPGIRKGIEFFDDEFNSIPAWKDADESTQTKYVPRGVLYNHAAGVRTFVWLLAAGVDGNEGDDFGFLHGKRDLPDDFSPRPVWGALQNTYALFSDTKLDAGIGIEASGVPSLSKYGKTAFQRHAFRNTNGKSIVAFWVAAHSVAGGAFPQFTVTMKLKNSGIKNPVLIDITTGKITPLDWKKGTTDTLAALPLRDAVHAIADADYFDWPVLPEAPSSLTAQSSASGVALKFELHAATTKFAIERRAGDGRWERIATQASATTYTDASAPRGQVRYRVRALNDAGESAFSNIVRVER
jgi:hypothetical protein